ncbi:hypothetical protein [Paenibacillus paeoniae]|uniref:Uncharacterized protein n=1 Tax=Paenibacillus paeoniae TaxID=2292705 RepID=A0A371PHD7_9BACL|nr:hypothetical protein [Paenibacillus paeoniae]REK75543.1 hypothetical protein DX130_00140 [Paenibacillus paeoniae]
MAINRDMQQESLNPALRVRPRVRWAVLTYFLYSAVFYTIFVLNGVDYTRVGESGQTLLLWYVAPLSGGALLTITMVTIYGNDGGEKHYVRMVFIWLFDPKARGQIATNKTIKVH